MAICNQSPFKLSSSSSSTNLFKTTPSTQNFQIIKCKTSLSSKPLKTEPEPVFKTVKTFAPATFANIGPGFDFLGCAIDGVGDHVTLSIDPDVQPGHILISSIDAPTKKMRAVLPTEISMKEHIWNSSQAGALVASVLQGDLRVLGKAMSSDKIVEPKRAPLIPGMEAVKRAALEAGAFGCTISGAGPTAVAVIDDLKKGEEIGNRMVEAFLKEGNLKASATVRSLDRVGARIVSSELSR
ncbi:hypothetical protein IFM89_015165 [Coptis chinensis]|uniref:GHMP kinase C-terminal domain-containing protein n=1 Tax=Coptis chinensis TaxID=261450 RepID=A0A835LB02_9MAGN|nr:hypothetical protein IFM89_015165 [Coptis chinensis]